MDNKEKMFEALKMIANACSEIMDCDECPFYTVCRFTEELDFPADWEFNDEKKTVKFS